MGLKSFNMIPQKCLITIILIPVWWKGKNRIKSTFSSLALPVIDILSVEKLWVYITPLAKEVLDWQFY